jgi:spermidine synthase
MFSFLSTTVLHSERNGKISVVRGFRRPEIEVDGYLQSGTYMKNLWRAALRRVGVPVKHVLLLGLGGGSAICEIHRRFPGCQIVVVEWDEVMIELAHRLRLFPANLVRRIILGDAVEVLPQLDQQFDLVLIDLFTGGTPEPRLSTTEMVGSIIRTIAPAGRVILNAFANVQLIHALAQQLDFVLMWKYKINHLALYHHLKLVTPLNPNSLRKTS